MKKRIRASTGRHIPSPEKELIRMKRSGQVTIPLSVRTHLKIHEGDYLEAIMTDKGLVLRPVRILLKKISLAFPQTRA